jgi:hypothetical protein
MKLDTLNPDEISLENVLGRIVCTLINIPSSCSYLALDRVNQLS